MEFYFKGISSLENDNDIKKHVRKVFNKKYISREDMEGRTLTVDDIPSTIQYLCASDIALNDDQLTNLYGNIKRILCCVQDDGDRDRKHASLAFEDKVKKMLDSIGANYVDEKYLQELNKQRNKDRKPSLPTPDFLLKTPITVRGQEVRWIECKNYYGTTIPKLVDRLGFVKAAKKYKRMYGSGIMAFHFGFNKDLEQVDGVMYADMYERGQD